MSNSEEGLLSFLFYVIIVYPATSWVLKKFPGNKGLMMAIGFLGIIAAGKTYVEVQERGPNYYAVLGVTRASNPLEIKRAYKKRSLELHPDKNPSPNAVEEFDRLKSAYDVLISQDQRPMYDKFGEEEIKMNRIRNENDILLEIFVFYLTWGMLAYILTLGKSSANSRNWIYTGQIVMLVAEVSILLQEVKMPEWFLPTVTEHEIVWLLHSLFPAYMNGCRCLGSFLYVDMDEKTRQLLVVLKDQMDSLQLQLRDIQVNINSLNARGVAGGKGDGKAAAPMKLTPTTKIKEMQALKAAGTAGAAAALKQDSLGPPKQGNNSGFYLMILGYIVLYYFFS